jgi:hypothetical protein
MKRKRTFRVPTFIIIRGHNEEDAIKESNHAIADGLIEPGFIEDGGVEEGNIIELEPVEE